MRWFFPYILCFCSLLPADEVAAVPEFETPVVVEQTIVAAPSQSATPHEEKEPSHQDSKELQEQNKTFQNAIFKTFASLAALIALVLFTVWLLKRISQNRHTFGLKSQSMQILEKRLLSPKTTLFLMEVDGKKIVFAESMLEVKVLYTESNVPVNTTPVPYQN